MKLTVLNSGSSGNGYVLEGRNSALLIECGVRPEDMFRLTACPVSKIAGALISHAHGDHAKYVHRYAALGIPIYGSSGTLYDLMPFHKAASIRKLMSMHIYTIGEFNVRCFDTVHDAKEPLGFIIEHRELGQLLFITDTSFCKYNFRDLALDHIMVEANYDDGILYANMANGLIDASRASRTRQTHFSLRQACELIKSVQTGSLKTVVLIHLSHDNADAAAFARKAEEVALFAKIYVAARGTTIELNKDENFTVL